MQLLNEKINGAEGTKLDEEFLKMEKVGNSEMLFLKYLELIRCRYFFYKQ